MQYQELITKDKLVYKGFIWQANKKKMLTEELFKKAAEAKKKLKKVNSFEEIISEPSIFEFVLAACMLSQKSIQHFSHDQLIAYLSKNIHFERLKEQNYLNELERYYLLISGDSIGGKMRNIIGQKGNEIFLRHFIKHFTNNNISYEIIKKGNNIQQINTENNVVLFNKKPKFIGKSVDFIVLKKDENGNFDIENPDSYISAGELKSGIDPAGADEHWKTAATAIYRIHKAFEAIDKKAPNIFFIGGAISKHMATEIINLIDKNKIKTAANLNYSTQMEIIISKIIL